MNFESTLGPFQITQAGFDLNLYPFNICHYSLIFIFCLEIGLSPSFEETYVKAPFTQYFVSVWIKSTPYVSKSQNWYNVSVSTC